MSVFKRGGKWSYDFWISGKRYRGSVPEARVKAQAERAETAIRDRVYEGTYGMLKTPAPLLRDFISDTFLPWSKVNKRTWVHDESFASAAKSTGQQTDGSNFADFDREVQAGST